MTLKNLFNTVTLKKETLKTKALKIPQNFEIFNNLQKARGFKEFLFLLPFVVVVGIFSYYPLYGWIYAFFDYRPPMPFSWDSFVGFKWFKLLVENEVRRAALFNVIKNTFAISGLVVATSWLPMLFAILLNEIKFLPFRKFVQTVTALPNFLSWVLVYAIAFAMFNSSGLINNILLNLGIIESPLRFLESSKNVWLTQWLWLTWKNLGWSAIIYIAAIAGIDPQLYEAAKVDGCARWQTIIHITIPGIMPTYFVLLLLAISNFLSNGMEQFFVFQNAFNSDHIQVLDLYIYNQARGSGAYSFSTAITIIKSLISICLLFGANKVSKWIRGETIV